MHRYPQHIQAIDRVTGGAAKVPSNIDPAEFGIDEIGCVIQILGVLPWCRVGKEPQNRTFDYGVGVEEDAGVPDPWRIVAGFTDLVFLRIKRTAEFTPTVLD